MNRRSFFSAIGGFIGAMALKSVAEAVPASSKRVQDVVLTDMQWPGADEIIRRIRSSVIQVGDFVRLNSEPVDDKENDPMRVVAIAYGKITTKWNAQDGTPQTMTHPAVCFYRVRPPELPECRQLSEHFRKAIEQADRDFESARGIFETLR